MDLSIRQATIGDLDELVRFTCEEAREAEGLEKIPETLRRGIAAALADNTKAMYWVAVTEQGRLIASVSALKEWSDWNAGYYWWIQSMYVKPSARGQGSIGLLIDAVSAEMKSQGGLELRLYVHQTNTRAIRAYEKLGFRMTPYDIMARTDSG